MKNRLRRLLDIYADRQAESVQKENKLDNLSTNVYGREHHGSRIW